MFSYRDVDEALHYFGRAMELDTEFSSPYAGIAYTHAQKILLGVSIDRDKDLQLGINAAETAIRLDRTDPFGYFAKGRITLFGGQHEKALDAFRHAIALNPNYALAHFGLAHGLWHAGRPEEALPHHDEAIRLSPHDPIFWAFLASKAIALTMTGRYEEGIALSLEAQRSEGSYPFSYLAEVSSYGLLGNAERAKDALGRLESIQPDISMDFVRTSLPILDSEAGDRFIQGLIAAGIKVEAADPGGMESASP
jgi:tetratricopeptide (TPR) repeat protein